MMDTKEVKKDGMRFEVSATHPRILCTVQPFLTELLSRNAMPLLRSRVGLRPAIRPESLPPSFSD